MNGNNFSYVKAEYKEQYIEEYRHNPLIEALPDILSPEEVIDKISFYPKFNEEERYIDSHIRIHLIQRLYDYFQPLPIHLDLESKLSRIIRQGYIGRNPLDKNFTISMKDGAESLNRRQLISNLDYKSTALGISFIGVSGMGKSTTLNKILSTYPQVIVHSKYKYSHMSMYQVVWLKLDCPHDGSLKGLCLDFFRKVDELIGTNYFEKYGIGKYAVNVLLPIMGQIARNICLGVLIIDEIQHLSIARSQGAEGMLNYFVTLVNTIGIPVVLVGTLKSINILQSQFRQARRGSGQGDVIWERMQNDKLWELLLNGMWSFQWVKKTVELTKEYVDLLYDESQGIIDIAIKIFVLSQIMAITSGKEIITPEIINNVAKKHLKLTRPAIEALKSGDIKKIAKYDDLYSNIDLSSFIYKQEKELHLEEKIKTLQTNKTNLSNEKNYNIKEEAILKLIELDVKGKVAKKLVEELMEEGIMETGEIVKKAFKKYIGDNKKETSSKEIQLDKNDLRYTYKKAKEENIKMYDLLKENGYIKGIDSLL